MRYRPLLPTPAALLASLLPAQVPDADPPAVPAPRFALHEWGTFTSLAGSDGVVLEGLHHEEESLPDFVHDLAQLAEVSVARDGMKFPASRVTQKMETPVVYFHADAPLRVTVDVSFTGGLMTQFYPLPELVSPRLDAIAKLLATRPVDFGGVPQSMVRWQVDVLPRIPGRRMPAVPDVDRDDAWAEARRVDAAFVRTVPDPAAGRVAETEQFLFYRGLGRFGLPLRAVTGDDGVTELTNTGDAEVPFAIAMTVSADGRGDFRRLGALPAGAALRFDVSAGDPRRLDADGLRGGLAVELLRALTARGLHDDEARAMVATWSRQWFLSPGTRVLWIVPDRTVSWMLPMRVDPEPRELVRVLVGRLEFLTPAKERAVERALLGRRSPDAAERAAAAAELTSLGRFLEPHLRRACELTGSDAVRDSAAELLAELAPH
ncbi:MAG: hypothetical protein IPM29_09160 [Planctomycetes bacterium]|nr:hypothetical protein [Planctomycetota bacterium]